MTTPLRVAQVVAFVIGVLVVLWFITVTTPSDDRTPRPAATPHSESRVQSLV